MTSRERITIILNGGIPDQVPIHDSYWGSTVERWHREGLPKNVSPDNYFGTEMLRIGGDYSLQFPGKLIEETNRYRTYVDAFGATRKDLKVSAGWTPQWLDFTIKSRDDWLKHKDRIKYNPSRISQSSVDACRRAHEQGKFVVYSGHACFHPTWQKVGMENMFIWMKEDPEFVMDMFDAHVQLINDMYDELKKLGAEFDGAWFSDDLGYRNAPLISPEMYREIVFPFHKRLCDHVAKDGLKSMLHSDGNVEPLIPHFLDAGITCLHPLEAKAGLDVRQLKPKYGDKLVLFGNIDVRKLAKTKEDIEEEISSKIPIAKEGGGYIYHSDHSVPDDISFSNYKFAIELVRKYGSY